MEEKRRRRQGRECSVSLKKGKLLLSAMAGEGLTGRAAVYECGGLMALVQDPNGPLNLLLNSVRSTRKDVSCRSLYAYLLEKYGLEDGDKLFAWHDGQGTLLFGRPEGAAEGRSGFHAGFRPLGVPVEGYESCALFVNHGMLVAGRAASGVLLGRVRAWEHGEVLCLTADPAGPLETAAKRHSERGVMSEALVAYVRAKFGPECRRYPARVADGRLYFSDKMPALEQPFDRFRPLALEHPRRRSCVTLMRNGSLRISNSLLNGVGPWVSLWEHGDVAALVTDPARKRLPVSRRRERDGAAITSQVLREWVKGHFCSGEGTRFYAAAQSGAVFFSPRPLEEKDLALEGYRLCPAGTEWRFLSVGAQQVYVSRQLAQALRGGFSLYRCGEQLALRRERGGMFKLEEGRQTLYSRALARYLGAVLGEGERRLYAAEDAGLLLLLPEGRAEEPPAASGRFSPVTERELTGKDPRASAQRRALRDGQEPQAALSG